MRQGLIIMKNWNDVKKDIDEALTDKEVSEINMSVVLVPAMVRQRKKLGLTQRDLAKLTGIQQSAIARIELLNVVPTINTLLKIAKALKMHIELVHDDNLINYL